MSIQSQMEQYKNEYHRRRARMLLLLKITVILLAISILMTGGILGVMFSTGAFDSADYDTDEDDGDGAPSLTGPKEGYVVIHLGDTGVSYKSFVQTTGAGELTVDASKVNLKQAGKYEVKYTFGDLSYELTVYVRQKEFTKADREKLYRDIEAKIKKLGITDSMSKAEKIEKVWEFVSDRGTVEFTDRSNIASAHGAAYSRSTWQTDWEEEAALTLKSKKGDCYSFYSLSKAFFEVLGIENLGIQRSEDSKEKGTHFWSVVKVDGGVWYYYDATRLKGKFKESGNRILMTEEKLSSYVTSDGGTEFYKFDKWSGFPKIATKSVG